MGASGRPSPFLALRCSCGFRQCEKNLFYPDKPEKKKTGNQGVGVLSVVALDSSAGRQKPR
jgi:hypothetical protein